MRRALLILLALLVALLAGALGAANWYLSGDRVRTQLADAVRRATGRELTIAGPVGLSWSLSPALALQDVSLSNPPGFSRPALARADRVTVQVALLPLFDRRVEIERITAERPDIKLERDAAGRPNWILAPPPPAPAPAPETATAPSQPSARFDLAIRAVEITGAQLAYGATVLSMPHLAYAQDGSTLAGTVGFGGATAKLAGHLGPITGATWPIDVALTGPGLVAKLAGTTAAGVLSVSVPDLQALSPIAGRPLPPLRDLAVTAALTPAGLGALQAEAGASTVGTARLDHARITAPASSAPAHLSAAGAVGAVAASLDGELGSLAALLAGAAPLKATLAAPGLAAELAGTLRLAGGSSFDARLRADDLGAVAAGLPSFRALDLAAQLSLTPGAMALHGLRLTSAQGDLAGDLALIDGARPNLVGALTSTSLDLDALQPRAVPAPPAAPPPQPNPPATPPAIPPAIPPALAQPARAIADTRLPFDALRAADADLQLTAISLHLGGQTLRLLQTHALLQDGTLHLDPFAVSIGPVPVRGTLAVQATPPAARLRLAPPPDEAPGIVDLRADLRAEGDTVRALASTLDGHLGLALVDGQVDDAVLERLAAGLLRSLELAVNERGATTIRCAALRAEAQAGVVQVQTLALDTSKLVLEGSGSVDLRDEALDLRLRPQLRLGGGLSVPVRLRGTLGAPKAALDPGALAPGRVGITIGGPAPADSCGPALAAARDGAAGLGPSKPVEPAKPLKPADLLRGLLR